MQRKISSSIFILCSSVAVVLSCFAQSGLFLHASVGAGDYLTNYTSTYFGVPFGLTSNATFSYNDNSTNMTFVPAAAAGYLWQFGGSQNYAVGPLVQFTIPIGSSKVTDNIPSGNGSPANDSYDLTTTSSVGFETNFMMRFAYFITPAFDLYTNIGYSLANTTQATSIAENGLSSGAVNAAAPGVSQTANLSGAAFELGSEIFLDNARKTALTAEVDYAIYATQSLSNINEIIAEPNVAGNGHGSITNRQLQLSDYALEIGLSRYF